MRRNGLLERGALILAVLSALFLLSSCAGMRSLTKDNTPQILIPISKSNVTDERARFREIYCAIREDHGKELFHDRPCKDALAELGEEPAVTGSTPVDLESERRKLLFVVVPGIFGECIKGITSPFRHAIEHAKQHHGFESEVIDITGRMSSTHNAEIIASKIERISAGLDRETRIVLIAYSKGAADTLEALVDYPKEMARVIAVVSVAGVISGAPLADSAPGFIKTIAGNFPFSACEPSNEGIESLTRKKRMNWLSGKKLPSEIDYFSLVALPKEDQVSAILKPFNARLNRVDPRNDGQVIFHDAIIPGGTLLGYARGDHWAVILPFSEDAPVLANTLITQNEYPRQVLYEAILRFVEERVEAPFKK